jgi:hypothetical protein
MPLVRSIIVGIFAAALIGGCTPIVMLGELGRPINFAIPFSLVVLIALAVTARVSRPRSWLHGIAAGLGFSIPVAAICFMIPGFDPVHLDEHAGELRFVGVSVLSLLVMALRATGAHNENKGAA